MIDKKLRKNFVVLPSYQIKLVGFLIFVLFIGSVLHGFFLYKITTVTLRESLLSIHNRFRSTWEVLKPAIVITNGISFFVLSLFFMVFTILISHRLIGPIFKITSRIRELANGRWNLPPLSLRKNDEGHMLSEAVNFLQQSMQKRFLSLQKLRQKMISDSPPGFDEIKQTIEEILNGIEFPS